MKFLLLLAVILFGAYAIGSQSPDPDPTARASAPAQPEPQGPKVTVSDIQCISHRTGTDMKGTVRNISGEALKYVKVYGTFDGQVFDGFINENPLQPGNYSTFLLPGPSSKAGNCTLLYVQDWDGNRIN